MIEYNRELVKRQLIKGHVMEMFSKLYTETAHGDENHQKWLKEKIDLFVKENLNSLDQFFPDAI